MLCRPLAHALLIAFTLDGLGHVERKQGNLTDAGSFHHHSLTAFRAIGDRQGIANALPGLAILAALPAALDEATFDVLLSEGAAMTLDEAIALGFDESVDLAAQSADRSLERDQAEYTVQAPSPWASERMRQLTVRERDVLKLIIAGKSNRAIAAALYVSLRTVEHHITSIRKKLLP
ncbi:MAG: helix-turn-helix transcriptional regulator [Dehalococcoidia bacterium]